MAPELPPNTTVGQLIDLLFIFEVSGGSDADFPIGTASYWKKVSKMVATGGMDSPKGKYMAFLYKEGYKYYLAHPERLMQILQTNIKTQEQFSTLLREPLPDAERKKHLTQAVIQLAMQRMLVSFLYHEENQNIDPIVWREMEVARNLDPIIEAGAKYMKRKETGIRDLSRDVEGEFSFLTDSQEEFSQQIREEVSIIATGTKDLPRRYIHTIKNNTIHSLFGEPGKQVRIEFFAGNSQTEGERPVIHFTYQIETGDGMVELPGVLYADTMHATTLFYYDNSIFLQYLLKYAMAVYGDLCRKNVEINTTIQRKQLLPTGDGGEQSDESHDSMIEVPRLETVYATYDTSNTSDLKITSEDLTGAFSVSPGTPFTRYGRQMWTALEDLHRWTQGDPDVDQKEAFQRYHDFFERAYQASEDHIEELSAGFPDETVNNLEVHTHLLTGEEKRIQTLRVGHKRSRRSSQPNVTQIIAAKRRGNESFYTTFLQDMANFR